MNATMQEYSLKTAFFQILSNRFSHSHDIVMWCYTQLNN